jgi:hypothetical protein
MYSYATHLRKGSYRSLPLSRSAAGSNPSFPSPSAINGAYESALGLMDEDEEIEDFYRVPLGTPNSKSAHYHHRRSSSRTHKPNGSISSFTDFMSAPGRPRKAGGHGRHNTRHQTHTRSSSRSVGDEDVLFDEEESTAYASTSSRSKFGTEASSSTAASDEERTSHADRTKLND